jgi:outer membrane protein assembly factor BamB
MFGDTFGGWGGGAGGWSLQHWAIDRWRYFALEVGDPDGDSVSVKFLWGDGRSTEWTSFTTSGNLVLDSVKYDTCGEYYVRLLLRDKRGTLAGPDTIVRLRVAEIAPLWVTTDLDWFDDYASPALGVVNGELVLCGVADEDVWCISARGEERWFFYDENRVSYAPAFGAGCQRVYVPGVYDLCCLDAETGGLVWRLALPDEAFSTPCIGPGGEIYLATANCELLMVRDLGDSAAISWRVDAGGWACAPAIAADGTVYVVTTPVGSGRLGLLALRPDGTEIWRDTSHMRGDCDQYPPVLDGRGRVLVPVDEPSALYCFNPDGTLAWQCGLSLFYCGSLAVGADDRVYFFDDNSRLVCLDSSGDQAWAAYLSTEHEAVNTPCLAADGSVVLYDPETDWLCSVSQDGEVLWEYSICDSLGWGAPHRARRDEGDDPGSPLIGPDGNLYGVGLYHGLLSFALGNTRLAQTAWPTYNHDPARSGWAGRQWP